MFRKMLFSALTALALAAGALMISVVPDSSAAMPMMSVVPHVDTTANLLQEVKACGNWNNWCGNGPPNQQCGKWNNWCGNGGGNCGPWNNWCGNSGGQKCGSWNNWCGHGSSNCFIIGGIKICPPGAGSGGGGGGSCIYVNGQKYCSYKHKGDCIWVNGKKYCRF